MREEKEFQVYEARIDFLCMARADMDRIWIGYGWDTGVGGGLQVF